VKAQETAKQIDLELNELQATLANIEDARPFEDLTVSLKLCHCRFFVLLTFSGNRSKTSAELTLKSPTLLRPWSKRASGLYQVRF